MRYFSAFNPLAGCALARTTAKLRTRFPPGMHMTGSPTASISAVRAIQILDSRGRPTVSAEVTLTNGMCARANAPSGASTGSAEAVELRDGNKDDFNGAGVRQAVRNVSELISTALLGIPATDQQRIDTTMAALDGTANWSRLGGNATVATSLAACRAGAMAAGMPLYRYIQDLVPGALSSMPMPMTNILSGGLHTRHGMDVQDFLVVPVGAETYSQGLDWICRVRDAATLVLAKRGLSTLLADEGGLSPACKSIDQALQLMQESFEHARLRPGEEVGIAIDMAATGLADGTGRYNFAHEGVSRTAEEISQLLSDLVQRYPILSVEDPCGEEDWVGWASITKAHHPLQLVGDDLFATQPERITRGKVAGVGNAVLIKVNQNGTLSGALRAMHVAKRAGFRTIVSARSGETEDDFIADLAVGSDAGQIKIGSVRSSERQSKYNRLAWIAAQEFHQLPLRNPWRQTVATATATVATAIAERAGS